MRAGHISKSSMWGPNIKETTTKANRIQYENQKNFQVWGQFPGSYSYLPLLSSWIIKTERYFRSSTKTSQIMQLKEIMYLFYYYTTSKGTSFTAKIKTLATE